MWWRLYEFKEVDVMTILGSGQDIPFHTVDWESEPAVEYPGERGVAVWRTRSYGNLRIRMVDYSAGYLADHWCEKGHILYCISGEITSELSDGRQFVLSAGMSYHVTDDASSHRTTTTQAARLFIVDGAFLKGV
jgi:hypothetical protein